MKVIHLSDYAEELNSDDLTPFIYGLFSKPENQKNVKIIFPKGIYHFRADKAYGKYHAITNHDNGYRRFAFPLVGFTNIEIDGQGSEFIFHQQIIPFLIEQSENIRLSNLVIDWEVPFTLEGNIVANNRLKNEIDIEIPDGFGYAFEKERLIIKGEGWEEPHLGENIVFDPKTKAVAYRTDRYYIPKPDNFQVQAVKLEENRFRLKTRFSKDVPPVGMIMTFKGIFTRNRHSPAIHISDSKNIRVENVIVHHCGGMGLIAEKSENIFLNRFDVKLRKNTNRIITSTADATHFCNCRGKVVIENCMFENMLDDATNVHGTYLYVEQKYDDRTVLARLNHPQQFGYHFASEGDTIQIINKETLLPKSISVVKGVEQINDQYSKITFTDEVVGLETGDGLENISWYPELLFRNNIVQNNRARSILISTPKKVIIENNSFSSMMSAILFEGDMDYWYESGAVRDVTIRNNTFLDGTYGGGNYPTIFINPHQKKMLPDIAYENNIRIENNIFKTFNYAILRATSVKNLVFTGNTIESSDTYQTWRTDPDIEVKNSFDVKIFNNLYRKKGKIKIVLDEQTRINSPEILF